MPLTHALVWWWWWWSSSAAAAVDGRVARRSPQYFLAAAHTPLRASKPTRLKKKSGMPAEASTSAGTDASTSNTGTAPPPRVTRARPARRRFIAQIPASISEDPALLEALAALPANYNFEVPKTIWRLKQMGAKSVAIQMPEGLLLFACTIADILERFAGCEAVIMGDVTYGACCVDDLSAAALGCDLLVHYGHSCLVPVDRMATDVLYVFVEIAIDVAHLVDTVALNVSDETTRLALCGTVQFTGALHAVKAALAPKYADVSLPQCRPQAWRLAKPEIDPSLPCVRAVVLRQYSVIRAFSRSSQSPWLKTISGYPSTMFTGSIHPSPTAIPARGMISLAVCVFWFCSWM